MPGFVGICGSNVLELSSSVNTAVRTTLYSPKAKVKDLHADAHLTLAKSYFDFLDPKKIQANSSGVYAWLDGEIYNLSELCNDGDTAFVDLLVESYQQNSLHLLLKRTNGVFIAIIYDTITQTLLLLTDRHGLKPFYIYARNNCFIFAPELKCFPCLKPFTLQIRRELIDSFVDLEYLLGVSTWFDGVEAVAPSTIYTYSIGANKLTKSRYWSWGSIKSANLSFDEAIEKMAFLVEKACQSCYTINCKMGVALSGGLDSRLIVAALEDKKPLTYTFGIPGSADRVVAKKVAGVAHVKNYQYDTHVDHWLTRRFEGIWKIDGMFSAHHMHYSHLMDVLPTILDVNISGYLGDVVAGGSYLKPKGGSFFLNQRITPSIAERYYGKYYELSDPLDSFFDIEKVDPYIIYNRGRRLIGMGAEEPYKTVPQRYPFMNNDLMDLMYSIPDEYRAGSRIYNELLLLKYPRFFKDIENSNTKMPITNSPNPIYKMRKGYHWVIQGFRNQLGLPISYTDVKNWIKEPETALFIKELLSPKSAVYANYTSNNYLEKYVIPHLQGKQNYVKQIMAALTIEIWLQQLLNKKYLNHLGKY